MNYAQVTDDRPLYPRKILPVARELEARPWTKGADNANDWFYICFELVTRDNVVTVGETKYDLSVPAENAAFVEAVETLVASAMR